MQIGDAPARRLPRRFGANAMPQRGAAGPDDLSDGAAQISAPDAIDALKLLEQSLPGWIDVCRRHTDDPLARDHEHQRKVA